MLIITMRVNYIGTYPTYIDRLTSSFYKNIIVIVVKIIIHVYNIITSRSPDIDNVTVVCEQQVVFSC